MPLSSINVAKDTAITYQPILVAVFTFPDGTILRVATHPLNAAEGGAQPTGITAFPHNSQDFFARIQREDLDSIQSMSDQGVDQIGSATIHMLDADKFLWGYDIAAGRGFKGAKLELYFLFLDVEGWTFSADFRLKFVGICGRPDATPELLTVSAINTPNLAKVQLPVARIQRRCIWTNPTTVAQRAEANDEDSQFYECGETRSLATALPCSYTKETCTQPNRFGGITFAPPDKWRGRSYLEGKTIEGANSPNDAKYGEPFPLVYGTTWIEPQIMNVIGDANSTRFEAVLCLGNLDGAGTTNPGRVLKVLVNDVEVPFVAYSPDKPLFRWEWVNPGNRDGSPNMDAGYDGKGDPYGSMAAIEVCVYRKVAASESLPRLRVLMGGPKIRTYTDATTYTDQYSSSPVWVLMDILTWSGVRYAQQNIASFVAANLKCFPLINYKDSTGATQQHERFDCSLAVRDRRAASELVKALLRGFNANLIWENGQLSLYIRSTLAEQQPAAVSGSNNITPVASKNYAGTATNGYVAYDFSEASIVKNDKKLAIRVLSKPILDQPNKVSFAIQDKHNGYVSDSFTLIDPDDVFRSDQEVLATLEVAGINSYDAAYRIGRTYLAEILNGNPTGGTAGTMQLEIETSVKAVHIRVGHIVRLSCVQFSISNQLFRVMRISPSTNYERVKLVLAWHNDNWYLDSFGQGQDPAQSAGSLDEASRPPYPWQPNTAAPIAGDYLFDPTEKTFEIRTNYEVTGDGKIAVVSARGVLPVTAFSDLRPPVVALQASVGSGGSIVGGGRQYWVGICAEDASGKLSRMSPLSSVVITPGGSGWSISVPVYVWPADTVGYRVFVGADPVRLAWQQSGSGTPTSITINGPINISSYGPPDSEAGKVAIYGKIVHHSGILGAALTDVGTGTLEVAGAGWTTNQFAGYDVSILATAAGDAQPLATFRITSNTADTLTVTPNPAAIANVGDVIVVRSKPTVSGLTLTDANWLNASSNGGLGLEVNAEKGRVLRIIAGKGRGYSYSIASNTDDSITVASDWVEVPDSTSRYIIEDAAWLSIAAETDLRGNATPSTEATLRIEVTNYINQTILLAGWTLSADAMKESIERYVPMRETYIVGSVATIAGTFQLEYLA